MTISKCLSRLFFIVIVASILHISPPAIGQTAVPMLINYQGELDDPVTGDPLPDGTYSMLFRIYDVESGGAPLWEEIHSTLYGNPIELSDGILNVLIGSGEGDPLTVSLFNGSDRWLEIRVETETLEPRQRLTSAPYSIVSENTRLLDGREASEFADATHAHSGADITSGTVSEDWIDPAIARDDETDAAVATHAAIPNAHHDRYADSEAVAAMGTKSDTNPLHHDKTTSFSDLTDVATDAQIPATIARDSEVSSEITTHSAVANAHHGKTTSFTELTDTATDAQIPNDITVERAKSSEDADTLDGFDSTHFVSATSDYGRSGVAAELYEGTETLSRRYVNTTGPDRVTGSDILGMLSVENTGTGPGLNSTAQNTAIVGTALADSGHGVQGFADGVGGRGVAGSAGGTNGRGIWASAPGEGGRGVYGITTDTSNVENYGGYFESWGQSGRGGYGKATGDSGIGLEGESEGEDGVGVRGEGKLAGVHCEGDLVVTGTSYRGTLGDNNGAPFPRPAYDSGWQEIKYGEPLCLDHKLGGNRDNYVVDLQFMRLGGMVHQKGYGGKVEGGEPYPMTLWMGAWWQRLTEESIEVDMYKDDDVISAVRVRIWVYN
jgi:hypothetical protein